MKIKYIMAILALASVSILGLCACSQNSPAANSSESNASSLEVSDKTPESLPPTQEEIERAALGQQQKIESLKTALDIKEDYRDSFQHGPKGAEYQKYIVLHDTEGDASAQNTISWWDSNGAGVAAHFIINKDGSIMQCVPLDVITHHIGFGDTGHNAQYGVEDESRDDKVGTTPIGSWASDYGMNSYSVGIEMVHSGNAPYPEEQLETLDTLIAYIDAYYGFESDIIDHKEWRSGNSDTSEAFADYLANYKSTRKHA